MRVTVERPECVIKFDHVEQKWYITIDGRTLGTSRKRPSRFGTRDDFVTPTFFNTPDAAKNYLRGKGLLSKGGGFVDG